MACALTDKLPAELIVKISDYLDPQDITRLAATCKCLSGILPHMLYVHDIKYDRHAALFWACDCGSLRMLDNTLRAGASVNHTFIESGDECSLGRKPIPGPTALMVASEAGYMEVVAILLKRGADVNRISGPRNFDHYKVSIMQRTIHNLSKHSDANKHKYLAILQALLDAGANPNLLGKSTDRTPLRMSLNADCPAEATGMLLEHGATDCINEEDEEDGTGHFLIEVIQMIVSAKNDVPKTATISTKLDLLFQRRHPDILQINWDAIVANFAYIPTGKFYLEIFSRHGIKP